jgi:hypothetical protein
MADAVAVRACANIGQIQVGFVPPVELSLFGGNNGTGKWFQTVPKQEP